IEPAPDLGVAIEGDDVARDEFVMIPNRTAIALIDHRRTAALLAEIKSFPVPEKDVSFNHAVRTAGKADARLRAPGASGGGKPIFNNHIIVRVQPEGDFVKNS